MKNLKSWHSKAGKVSYIYSNIRSTAIDGYTAMSSSEIISFSLRTPSLILFPFSIIPSALYAFQTGTRKSALVTDILALSFSDNAISLLKIDSFQTGCILLSGLFLYDIWWVFGTEVVSPIQSMRLRKTNWI